MTARCPLRLGDIFGINTLTEELKTLVSALTLSLDVYRE